MSTKRGVGVSGDVEALGDALWDALDAKHDRAYHVHAAECCWCFPGVMDTLRDHLAAAEQRGRETALREAAERFLAYDDEMNTPDAVGAYMQIRFGGDTGEEADWQEANRVARESHNRERADRERA